MARHERNRENDMGTKLDNVSIDGAPTITFDFLGSTSDELGDVAEAELAGAVLRVEVNRDGTADMRITAMDGFVLANITVKPRKGRALTENVMDIGSALLWSHWRHQQASRR